MDNVYVLVTYLALVIGLVGCGLMKLSDILEQRRDRKYYEMIKQDAGFWQMKAEQTGMNIMDWLMEEGTEKAMNKVNEMTAILTKTYDGASQEVATKIKFDFDEDDEEVII